MMNIYPIIELGCYILKHLPMIIQYTENSDWRRRCAYSWFLLYLIPLPIVLMKVGHCQYEIHFYCLDYTCYSF